MVDPHFINKNGPILCSSFLNIKIITNYWLTEEKNAEKIYNFESRKDIFVQLENFDFRGCFT